MNHLQNLSYNHISPDLLIYFSLLQQKVRPSMWSKHAYGRVWSAPLRSLSSSASCLLQPIRCFAVVWSNRMDQSQHRSNSTYKRDKNDKKKKTCTGAAEQFILFMWNPNVVTWNIFERSYSFHWRELLIFDSKRNALRYINVHILCLTPKGLIKVQEKRERRILCSKWL